MKTLHIQPLRGAVGCEADSETVSHEFEGINGFRCLLKQVILPKLIITVGFWNVWSVLTLKQSKLIALC